MNYNEISYPSEAALLSTEPEREVYPDTEKKEGELIEEDDHVNGHKIMSTSGLELNKADLHHKGGMFDDSDADVVSCALSLELASEHHTWASDDDSAEEETKNSDFHDSIRAIQEEASRVDAVLAFDQLDTLKQELNALKRALKNATAEMEEQRALIKLKDDRLATLELERDLYKADANKFKTDLQNAIEQMRSNHGDLQSVVEQISDTSQETVPEEKAAEEEARVPVSLPESPILLAPQFRHEPFAIRESDFLARSAQQEQAPEPSSYMSRDYFNEEFHGAKAVSTSGSSRTSTPEMNSSTRYKPRALLSLRRMMRPRQAMPPCEPEQVELVGISLDVHVEEMQQRLKASTETSEKLRKRLAMISRYYENLVRRLQERLVTIQTDQTKMEVDLANQIASIDIQKRRMIGALEARLREKDNEIERLKGLRSL